MTATREDEATDAQAIARPLRILVSHPSMFALSRAMSVGLAERGHRVRYVTSFVAGEAMVRRADRIPGPIGRRIARDVGRRLFRGMEALEVERRPAMEFAYIAAARLGLAQTAQRLMWARNAGIDRRAARRLRAGGWDAAIAFDGSAIRTLQAARAEGALGVLNQVIGFVGTWEAIRAEELERHPEFGPSLGEPTPPRVVEQCRQELLTAERILVPSDYVARTAIDTGASEAAVRLVPFGVEADRFRPAARAARREGPLRLLFVGQISQRKGIKYLLEAMKSLPPGLAELDLVGSVIGSEAPLAPYRDLFRHHRNMPHREIHRVFARADCFVYPSLHEGSPLAILEAMASGLPVIATPNAGSLVTHGQEGWIVPIRDPEALAAAIGEAAGDWDRVCEMGRAARRLAEAHDWRTYAERVEAVLQEARS
jgi:glycosyltransferase involved in cell wall biosynthesis